MFLWHLACMSYSWKRRRLQGIFILALLMPLILYITLRHVFGFSAWWGYAVIVGELALFLTIDCIVKFQFRRALKRRLKPLLKLLADQELPDEKIQKAVDLFLEAMAWRLLPLTEDQHEIAREANHFPGFCTAKRMVINDLVAGALKSFWRVHWLARVLGFEVEPRWKEYLSYKYSQ